MGMQAYRVDTDGSEEALHIFLVCESSHRPPKKHTGSVEALFRTEMVSRENRLELKLFHYNISAIKCITCILDYIPWLSSLNYNEGFLV